MSKPKPAASDDSSTVEEAPPPVFRVRLVDDVNAAQFNVDGVEVELDQDNPVYETERQATFKSLLEIPFLEEA